MPHQQESFFSTSVAIRPSHLQTGIYEFHRHSGCECGLLEARSCRLSCKCPQSWQSVPPLHSRPFSRRPIESRTHLLGKFVTGFLLSREHSWGFVKLVGTFLCLVFGIVIYFTHQSRLARQGVQSRCRTCILAASSIRAIIFSFVLAGSARYGVPAGLSSASWHAVLRGTQQLAGE